MRDSILTSYPRYSRHTARIRRYLRYITLPPRQGGLDIDTEIMAHKLARFVPANRWDHGEACWETLPPTIRINQSSNATSRIVSARQRHGKSEYQMNQSWEQGFTSYKERVYDQRSKLQLAHTASRRDHKHNHAQPSVLSARNVLQWSCGAVRTILGRSDRRNENPLILGFWDSGVRTGREAGSARII